jgi:hypothetical protein
MSLLYSKISHFSLRNQTILDIIGFDNVGDFSDEIKGGYNLKNFLIGYLEQQPDWFRMSIPDLVWFLNTPEVQIRQLIDDERIPASPKTEYLPSLVVEKPDTTPHYLYKYQIIHLVRGLGILSVDHPEDFWERMDVIEANRPQYGVSWKIRALHRN